MESSASASGEDGAPPLGARRQRLILVAAILGTTVVTVDGTVVNVALPAIEDDLGGGLAGQQWTANAYLVTLGSLLLIGGSLGDIFGERRVFAFGVGAGGASGDRGELRSRRARQGRWRLDGVGRRRHGARAADRGAAGRRRVVALDLRHQRADRARDDVADPARGPPGARARPGRPRRCGRRPPVRPGAGGEGLRPDRAGPAWL